MPMFKKSLRKNHHTDFPLGVLIYSPGLLSSDGATSLTQEDVSELELAAYGLALVMRIYLKKG